MRALFACPAALALALAPAASAQTVHVVDQLGGAGSTFTDIGPAATAALSGDLILVRPGQYGGFTIDGKAVSVEADGAGVAVTGQASVKNIPVGSRVVLRGLGLDASHGGNPGRAAFFEDSAGMILVEDCHAMGGLIGFQVDDCDNVDFVRSTGYGIVGFGLPAPGVGLIANRSEIGTWLTEFVGGDGFSASCDPDVPAQRGGDAALVEAGWFYDHGGYYGGGYGGDGCETEAMGCLDAGDGGHGVVFTGAFTAIELGGASWDGGPAGNGAPPNCWFPQEGNAWTGSPVTFLDGDPRLTSTNSPVRVGQTLTVTNQGTFGDFVVTFVGPLIPQLYAPTLKAPFLTDGSFAIFYPGAVSGGFANKSFTIQPITGLSHAQIVFQSIFVQVSPTNTVLGPPSVATILP